jgi:hypothetical protein
MLRILFGPIGRFIFSDIVARLFQFALLAILLGIGVAARAGELPNTEIYAIGAVSALSVSLGYAGIEWLWEYRRYEWIITKYAMKLHISDNGRTLNFRYVIKLRSKTPQLNRVEHLFAWSGEQQDINLFLKGIKTSDNIEVDFKKTRELFKTSRNGKIVVVLKLKDPLAFLRSTTISYELTIRQRPGSDYSKHLGYAPEERMLGLFAHLKMELAWVNDSDTSLIVAGATRVCIYRNLNEIVYERAPLKIVKNLKSQDGQNLITWTTRPIRHDRYYRMEYQLMQ